MHFRCRAVRMTAPQAAFFLKVPDAERATDYIRNQVFGSNQGSF